jgi:hypothetical protein
MTTSSEARVAISLPIEYQACNLIDLLLGRGEDEKDRRNAQTA